MDVLDVLRAWRSAQPVLSKASPDDITTASMLLESFERDLGPGKTKLALDLAIVAASGKKVSVKKHKKKGRQ